MLTAAKLYASMQFIFKTLVLLAILMILVSLGQAMYYLVKDQGSQERTVRALSWRIGLSLGLILLLFLGYGVGLIQPHGLPPESPSPIQQPGSAQGRLGVPSGTSGGAVRGRAPCGYGRYTRVPLSRLYHGCKRWVGGRGATACVCPGGVCLGACNFST